MTGPAPRTLCIAMQRSAFGATINSVARAPSPARSSHADESLACHPERSVILRARKITRSRGICSFLLTPPARFGMAVYVRSDTLRSPVYRG